MKKCKNAKVNGGWRCGGPCLLVFLYRSQVSVPRTRDLPKLWVNGKALDNLYFSYFLYRQNIDYHQEKGCYVNNSGAIKLITPKTYVWMIGCTSCVLSAEYPLFQDSSKSEHTCFILIWKEWLKGKRTVCLYLSLYLCVRVCVHVYICLSVCLLLCRHELNWLSHL